MSLELVDQDVLVAFEVAALDVLVVAQQLDRLDQDVVEIEGAVFAQHRLIALVAAGNDLLEVGRGLQGVGFGRDQLALGARDHRENGARRVLARLKRVFGADALYERHLVGVVVDREAAGHADELAIDAQDTGADGVKGAERDATRKPAEEPLDAVAQLTRRLVGEGDGHDARRRHADLVDQVGDAMRDDAGFAAAGPGEDEKRSLTVDDGFVLGRVKPFEYGHGIACRRDATTIRKAKPDGSGGVVCELVYSFARHSSSRVTTHLRDLCNGLHATIKA